MMEASEKEVVAKDKKLKELRTEYAGLLQKLTEPEKKDWLEFRLSSDKYDAYRKE